MDGFPEHIAIGGSLKEVFGRDAAGVWAVVQLDYDKEEVQCYVIYGTMLADLVKYRERSKERFVSGWAIYHPY